MTILDVLVIGFGLAMDAFAVSVCKGLAIGKRDLKKTGIIAGYFAVFQMAMPLAGYLLGEQFSGFVAAVDHWIAFAMLGLIGGNMIREALQKGEETATADVSPKTMLPLAVATSIDAFITGVTFAFMQVNLWVSIGGIGIITFALCVIGVWLGRQAGKRLSRHAEIVGGIVLILIGVKTLIEHLIG